MPNDSYNNHLNGDIIFIADKNGRDHEKSDLDVKSYENFLKRDSHTKIQQNQTTIKNYQNVDTSLILISNGSYGKYLHGDIIF